MSSLRRGTSLYAQNEAADAAFFVDEGLVKLTRDNGPTGRIILAICGPGQLVGEEVFSSQHANYYTSADVLTTVSVLRIPRQTINNLVASSHEMGSNLVRYLLEQKLTLAQKVELLCLHDVEYRILHYLAELSELIKPSENGEGHQIPITQLELADLVGATRETTSTTLNHLERRGLVKLSRRLMSIPSPETLRTVASRAEQASQQQSAGQLV